MKVFHSRQHEAHSPQFFLQRGLVKACEEQSERADLLLHGAISAGLTEDSGKSWGLSEKRAVHTGNYLQFLSEAHKLWRDLPEHGPEVLANVHPLERRTTNYPNSIIGRAGWHMADLACAIGEGTYDAAIAAADIALSAADNLILTSQPGYALCRPPGHHASADAAAGHCYLNNIAIAAQHLRSAYERVAILDIDVHHGNGTQSIFYQRNDVLTVSIHADPVDFYPFYQGYADETGEGIGKRYNKNFPLPVGSSEQQWFSAVGQGIAEAVEFDAQCLLIALGLDAHIDDPLGALKVTTEGFGKIGSMIGGLTGSRKLPVLLVQEGGYLSPVLGENIESFLSGFLKSYS